MEINRRFTDAVRQEMKRLIAEADGNEVFFVGTPDEDGVVTAVRAMARGREHDVLVHRKAARAAGVLIHNHPSGDLTPSDADMCIASDSSERGQGFYIINNTASEVYAVIEPIIPKKITPLDVEAAALYISDGGPLSAQSDSFEERPVQIDLLRAITSAFNTNALGVFEAGTGVGKSYAYLIPALLWAKENGERIVVSTGTINLQQQLCEKDIPAAKKITGLTDIKAALVKGRQNYVCRRRLAAATADRELFSEDAEITARIAEWAAISQTGSKSDLAFFPPENVWSRVKSESDACMGMRCPFHGNCFVMQVRKEAASAQILVVNHHLLFADIESRLSGIGYDDQAVLPPYRRIIFDEAHTIENAATSFFSESVNRFQLLKLVNQLYRVKRGSHSGLIVTLSLFTGETDAESRAQQLAGHIKNDTANVELAALDLLQDAYTFRLSPENSRSVSSFLSLIGTLAKNIGELVAVTHELMNAVSDEDRNDAAYWEAKLAVRRLEDAAHIFADFLKWDETQDTVFWLQRKSLPADMLKTGENGLYVAFSKTPLDIAPLMNSGVFEPMHSVVCTSATLSVNRSFNYWMRRSGIRFADTEALLTGEYPSPFPYKKNMLFAVPRDAPLPENPVQYDAFVAQSIPQLILAADGRTLVLFTSYESLKNAFRAARQTLSRLGFGGTLLRQGDDDNARLLEVFKREPESVLFATDSFWQGVDVPGDSLSQVIIAKLPFSVPNDPVFEARSDAVKRRGGNPFMEISVPEAVMKFRQGIGRLIRRSSDRGAVVLLDRRVYEKKYGGIFLNSMPEAKTCYAPLSDIADRIAEFLLV